MNPTAQRKEKTKKIKGKGQKRKAIHFVLVGVLIPFISAFGAGCILHGLIQGKNYGVLTGVGGLVLAGVLILISIKFSQRRP